jgi:hypothetical protein
MTSPTWKQVSAAECLKWQIDNPMKEACHGDTWMRFNPTTNQHEEKYHFHGLPTWEPVTDDVDPAFKYFIPMEDSNAR